MAPRPTLSAAFPVHSYEVDAFGALEVPALSGYLQELAGRHAAELGVGIEALRAKGLTWILARQRIELPLAIAMGDTLEIETWPSGFDRLGAVREFVVRRTDGAEAARASTVWYVLDLSTRKVVRPHDVLDPRLPRERGTSVSPIAHAKLPELERFELEKRFRVRYGDIDGNFHVTNASYVAWAIEAVPMELWRGSRLREVEVQFLAEERYGAAILSRVAPRSATTFAHAIVSEEDGRELARLRTEWAPREPAPR